MLSEGAGGTKRGAVCMRPHLHVPSRLTPRAGWRRRPECLPPAHLWRAPLSDAGPPIVPARATAAGCDGPPTFECVYVTHSFTVGIGRFVRFCARLLGRALLSAHFGYLEELASFAPVLLNTPGPHAILPPKYIPVAGGGPPARVAELGRPVRN